MLNGFGFVPSMKKKKRFANRQKIQNGTYGAAGVLYFSKTEGTLGNSHSARRETSFFSDNSRKYPVFWPRWRSNRGFTPGSWYYYKVKTSGLNNTPAGPALWGRKFQVDSVQAM